MRILVTGGAGFIGSALVRHLVAAGADEVLNLDKLTYAAVPGALDAVAGDARYRFVRADIGDRPAVARALQSFRPQAVVNLAAESHVDRSIDAPAAFVQTNVVGTVTLLEAVLDFWRGLDAEARAAFRFLHVSTDEVYGALGEEGRFTEASAHAPNSPYAASKAASDHFVRAWNRTYGLPTLVSNCCNNYGPFQFPEKLIPLTVIKALLGEDLPVYGTGRNVRDWLHVDDHARAIDTILRRGRVGESYLVGADAERRNLAVVEAICDLVDHIAGPAARGPRRGLIRFVADRPGHDFRYAVDPAKLGRELGWRPRHAFEAGLAATVRWYVENRKWWEAVRAGDYTGERLGLAQAPA